MEHIAKVLEVAETFEKDLKGGTGYEGMFDVLAYPPLIQCYGGGWFKKYDCIYANTNLGVDAMRSYT